LPALLWLWIGRVPARRHARIPAREEHGWQLSKKPASARYASGVIALTRQNPLLEKNLARRQPHRRWRRASARRVKKKTFVAYDGASGAPMFANGAVTSAFSYALSSAGRGGGGDEGGATTCALGECPGEQLIAGPLEIRVPTRVFYPTSAGVAYSDTFSWVDFSAGFGDTVSLGLTAYIRNQWDIGSVDYMSRSYRYGEYGGVANSLGMGAGLFTGAARFGSTVTVTRWGGPGAWYMVGGKSTSNWWLSGTRFRYPYGSANTIEVAAGRLSYPPGWEWFKGLIGQRVLKP
jgi:hypothetical protein